ncbi:DUF2164 domain-containing protein [Marinobacter hydrocarbonoclasticus]|nr:DUF2164 domain-containing protein [Marinobacter nauticus]
MITLDPAQRTATLRQLTDYFEQQLDQDLGQFEGEFLLDHLLKTLGPVIYNQALQDAQALLQPRMELVVESLYELEKAES